MSTLGLIVFAFLLITLDRPVCSVPFCIPTAEPTTHNATNTVDHHKTFHMNNNTMGAPTSTSSSSTFMTGLQDCDVACGRGGLANKHPGNRLLRRICNENKTLYQSSTNPIYKQCLILSILKATEKNGGRFLARTKKGWTPIPDKKAKDKIAQLLREASEDPSAIATKPMEIRQSKPAAQDYITTGIFDITHDDDCLQTPARHRRPISPEYTKDMSIPEPVPSGADDLSNLLQQPLLEEPPTLMQESSSSVLPAMPAFDADDEELFERIALQTIETEIATHGPSWSPRFARHAGIEYSATAAL